MKFNGSSKSSRMHGPRFKEVVLGNRGVRSPNTEDMAGEMGPRSRTPKAVVVFLGVWTTAVWYGESLPIVRATWRHGWSTSLSNNCDPPIRPNSPQGSASPARRAHTAS